MSRYSEGRDVEYAVIRQLRRDGYEHMRGASSKGFCDSVFIKPGQILFVNVKKTDMPGPGERVKLLRVAGYVDAVPLCALGPASRVTFWRLTGPGPRDRIPWAADEVAA